MTQFDIGTYVLYAMPNPDTKLDYNWRGPGVITAHTNTRLVYTIKPCTDHDARKMNIHACRLRKFAPAGLHLTQQIKEDISRDHSGNIVAKIVSHKVFHEQLWCMCRWKGFTANADTYQKATVLYQDCPKRLIEYHNRAGTLQTEPWTNFIATHFPSLGLE